MPSQYRSPFYYRAQDERSAANLRSISRASGRADDFKVERVGKAGSGYERWVHIIRSDGSRMRFSHASLRRLKEHGYVLRAAAGRGVAGAWVVTDAGRELLERVPDDAPEPDAEAEAPAPVEHEDEDDGMTRHPCARCGAGVPCLHSIPMGTELCSRCKNRAAAPSRALKINEL